MADKEEIVIGVVDTARVLAESKSGKTVGEQLQRRGQKWQEQLAVLEQQRSQAQEKGKKLQPGGAPSAAFKVQHELRMVELSMRHAQELAQAELEAYSEFYQSTLSQTLAAQLDAMGKEKKFTMVLTGPSAQMPFVAKGIDITAEAINRFDAAFNIDKL